MARSARRPPRRVAAVILAAGAGKRMKSAIPKVLHEVCGRPSLWHVLRAATGARPSSVAVVVNHDRERVEAAVSSWGTRPGPVYVDQGEPLGTGHAVLAAEEAIGDADDVLVLCGDDPLFMPEDIRSLLRLHRRTGASATLLTTFPDDPTGYGRVIREGNALVDIVEEFDASPEIRRMGEVATLSYAFRRDDLFAALPLVARQPTRNEYYLHHVLPILRDKGLAVAATPVDLGGGLGLNSRGGLAKVTRLMRERIVAEHMASGVTFVDPATSYVDVGVRIGRDTVVHPMTFLQGATRIGSGASVGPGTRIVDSSVGDGADVAFSVVRGARVGARVAVGPYANLRAGTVLDEGAKAGSFVEIKASRVGKGSKVPHLSYVGDTTIGRGANIGAGVVTVNYDGSAKHRTAIGDGAFIGSDTMLIAPIKVGKEASTGAGSVITRDVPAGALAVERTEQRVIRGYATRKKRRMKVREQGEDRG